MESNTFSEILQILRLQFAERKEPVFKYLKFLSEVKRFRALAMFMSKSDKEGINYTQTVLMYLNSAGILTICVNNFRPKSAFRLRRERSWRFQGRRKRTYG